MKRLKHPFYFEWMVASLVNQNDLVWLSIKREERTNAVYRSGTPLVGRDYDRDFHSGTKVTAAQRKTSQRLGTCRHADSQNSALSPKRTPTCISPTLARQLLATGTTPKGPV